jgi:hypothetical protein
MAASRPNSPVLLVQVSLVLGTIDKSLVLISNDLDVALVEAEHLYYLSSANATSSNLQINDLLWAFLVNNVGVVLGLAAVLPNKINDQLATAFILACINGLDILLPGPCWRTPTLRCRRSCRIGRVLTS